MIDQIPQNGMIDLSVNEWNDGNVISFCNHGAITEWISSTVWLDLQEWQ